MKRFVRSHFAARRRGSCRFTGFGWKICVNRNTKKGTDQVSAQYASFCLSAECKVNRLQALWWVAVLLSSDIIQLFRSVSPLLHLELFEETRKSRSRNRNRISFACSNFKTSFPPLRSPSHCSQEPFAQSWMESVICFGYAFTKTANKVRRSFRRIINEIKSTNELSEICLQDFSIHDDDIVAEKAFWLWELKANKLFVVVFLLLWWN